MQTMNCEVEGPVPVASSKAGIGENLNTALNQVLGIEQCLGSIEDFLNGPTPSEAIEDGALIEALTERSEVLPQRLLQISHRLMAIRDSLA